MSLTLQLLEQEQRERNGFMATHPAELLLYKHGVTQAGKKNKKSFGLVRCMFFHFTQIVPTGFSDL